jgi:hypothetical protein
MKRRGYVDRMVRVHRTHPLELVGQRKRDNGAGDRRCEDVE